MDEDGAGMEECLRCDGLFEPGELEDGVCAPCIGDEERKREQDDAGLEECLRCGELLKPEDLEDRTCATCVDRR